MNKVKRGLKLIGALSLAAMLLYGCDTAGTSTTTEKNASKEVKQGDLNIAFVYTDSVINKYDYFKSKSEELTAKGKKFEGDLQGRASGFQQEVQTFQQTGGNMTVNQQRAKQEELAKKEQNLMTYRDNLMQELSADEAALYSEVYDRVQKYLKTYAENNELTMILSYTRGGAVWYGNDALDLTESVIEGLNKAYTAAPADTAK
ncbi:OmpH family outer membrane protein [Algoriphagus persicinus]|uniref:OmpH family outer membrane protein n=1 Tax=Algoriphagus persicinus TaxID=3108754 RepID=UPI002B3DB326|nr:MULTISPECIES: OmpH family outer membrane protein [unclassified Algoriphagus]MEB2779250.1 OmpH family outer membrane protein [Algoriphagus sp. C2-6-M1]MEB2784081.1 OmpH family outer membrane protein [Algoriphagus sp. E1-3-M2]